MRGSRRRRSASEAAAAAGAENQTARSASQDKSPIGLRLVGLFFGGSVVVNGYVVSVTAEPGLAIDPGAANRPVPTTTRATNR